MTDRLAILRKLDSIGGWVEDSEIAHHLGADALDDLYEAETEGLVVSQTMFTLTERGGALVRGEQT